MTLPKCKLQSLSIVLVGNFNPAIFHPIWLADKKLIGEREFETAHIQIIQSEIALFSAGPFALHADRQRLVVSVADALHSQVLRDLLVSILTALAETPVTMIGLNREMNYSANKEDLDKIGHGLVPKKRLKGLLEKPETRSVKIWGNRPGSEAKRLQLEVGSSEKVASGVMVRTNEHFELDEPGGAKAAREVIEDNWDEAQNFAQQLAQQLLALYLEDSE